MLNDNTLEVLNRIGFGADINSLESYIIDYKQARLVSNLAFYADNYNKLCKILSEIKPDSVALKNSNELEPIELNRDDCILEKYGNAYPKVIYGIDSNGINVIKSSFDAEDNGVADITAIANVLGVNINCYYVYGKLHGVYLVGETKKYQNITKILVDNKKVKEYYGEFSKYGILELRGVLTILNNCPDLQMKSLNISSSVMRNIRLKINIDKLDIVYTDVFIKDTIDSSELSDAEFNNQWDKFEYLSELNFHVPHYILLRNISSDNLEDALLGIAENFSNQEKDFSYPYRGMIIRFNNDIICTAVGHTFIYNDKDGEPGKIFQSTVRSISSTDENNGLGQKINIIEVKCNDNLKISSIPVNDLYDLEKYKIMPGSKIKFQLIENKLILV